MAEPLISCVTVRDWETNEELNACVQECSKPLLNQQSFAVSLYTGFYGRVQEKMESQCLNLPAGQEAESCIKNVRE